MSLEFRRVLFRSGVSFIHFRNLNIDPEMYLRLLEPVALGPSVGFTNFKKRLRKLCPWLKFGYFNPWLGDRAELTAPMPGEWTAPVPKAKDNDILEEDHGEEERA